MSNITRCISYNKKGKRCRTRLAADKKFFCCDNHIPPNYDMVKESCYICSEKLEIKDMIILKCNHIHHINCLAEWFQISSENDETIKCPLCRKEIFDQEQIIKKKKFSYYKV